MVTPIFDQQTASPSHLTGRASFTLRVKALIRTYIIDRGCSRRKAKVIAEHSKTSKEAPPTIILRLITEFFQAPDNAILPVYQIFVMGEGQNRNRSNNESLPETLISKFQHVDNCSFSGLNLFKEMVTPATVAREPLYQEIFEITRGIKNPEMTDRKQYQLSNFCFLSTCKIGKHLSEVLDGTDSCF